jgi:Zn-finger protein
MNNSRKAIDKDWRGKQYAFFSHRQCEAFPCHQIEDESDFNCLFCYCPLYPLQDCGGAFVSRPDGAKDCSSCVIPHKRDNYGLITSRVRNSASGRTSA